MTSTELLQLSGVILTSLGGASAIIFGFSSWLGKVWASRLMEKEKAEFSRELASLSSRLTQDVESYKVKLKKSELLFEKEYEAASEFIALRWSFCPKYTGPDMEWEDACDEMAKNLGVVERKLDQFLSKNGAVIDENTQGLISTASGIAGQNNIEGNESNNIPIEARNAADDLFKDAGKMNEIQKILIAKLQVQTSI